MNLNSIQRNAVERLLVQLNRQIDYWRSCIAFATGADARAKAVANLAYLLAIRQTILARMSVQRLLTPRDVNRAAALLRRLGNWSLIIFAITLVTFVVILASPIPDPYQEMFGVSAVAVVFLAGILHVALLPLRGIVNAGFKPWRFSVRNLIMVTTIFACVLGVLDFIVRSLSDAS